MPYIMSDAYPRLRIAMISYYLPSGSKIGVGYQVHALANEMVRQGHEVTVISSCPRPLNADYAVLTIPLRGSNRTFKFAFQMRKVDLSGFDVLHAHGDNYWLWKRRTPAHVRTLHGSCFAEAMRIRGMREKLRMVLLGCSEILGSVVADRTVLVSHATRRWAPWVRTVIPNGVDASRFAPSGVRRPSLNPSILFVGTFGNRKRGSLLYDVFQRQVKPMFPDAELWMVCKDAPQADGIKVFGRVSDEALIDLYQRADQDL